MVRRIATTLAALLLISAVARAQQTAPNPAEFLGYELGTHFTPHQRVLDYFGELAKRSDVVKLQTIGETYERRPLITVTITSPANHARLDAIRQSTRALASGEIDAARVEDLAKNTPAVIWLGFGVHGNEASSTEAAMLVASSLVRDADARRLLDDLVIVIDPLSNPDGRERYVDWYRRTRGEVVDPNPEASEHAEPWPGGRPNHYLVDMNRDWSWATQRETVARIGAFLSWNPQVFVDFHEMAHQSSYFFPPGAKPINANLPKDVERWLEVFGRANAEAFSAKGWPFFVGDRFDLFYPGYGDSWPSLHGAIGMTYEMAGGGRAGLAVEKADETVLTLGDRLTRHYTAAMTTLRTSAANREALLRYTHDAARAQIAAGRNTFLILADSPNFTALVEKLQRQAIRVDVLAAPATIKATRIDRTVAESRSFPAGTAVVSTRQPLGGLANTLLETRPTFTPGFLEEQREKAVADEPDDFYDLTTWSLPLAMNVEAWATTVTIPNLRSYAAPAKTPFRAGSYGYLVNALDTNLYRLVGRLLAEEVRFSVSTNPIDTAEKTFARGTLVILKNNNAETLDATLGRLATESGASLHPIDTGWVGTHALGADAIRFVKKPSIALVGGPGTNSTSYGMLWHTLDVDTPIPHSTIQTENLRNLDLGRYDVIVFPDGNYADRVGKLGVEKLKTWVSDGGVVIAVGGANTFLREKDVEISKLKPWEPPKSDDADDDDHERPVDDQRYHDFRIPGSAFRSVMNERSYLTFGLPRTPVVLIEGSNAYRPVAHKVDNIVTIAAKDALISGVAWPESLERIQGSAYMVSEPHGRGRVITFADDPHFRLFWRGTLPLFLNAVVYSPSFTR